MISAINDRRSAQRADNLRLLIEQFGQRDLSRDDICELLGVTNSGVRYYVLDLGPLLEVIDSGPAVQRSYRLTSDAARVTAFLANLDEVPAHRQQRNRIRSKRAATQRDPTRHIHVMQHDAHYAIRVPRFPVRRDPLVAAFFGSVAAIEVRA
jgi:hypothetical protein